MMTSSKLQEDPSLKPFIHGSDESSAQAREIHSVRAEAEYIDKFAASEEMK